MAKATFRLADEANTSDRVTYTVEVDAAVTDEWLLTMQDWFAANLPPGVSWAAVRKYSIQIEESRELDPAP